MKEKAKMLYELMTGKSDFKASDGWLTHYKNRYGIKSLTVSGEKLSAQDEDADEFCEDLAKVLIEKNVDLENFYSGDETGLNWESLPRKTLARYDEATASGWKQSKERVTILNAANATGTNRIPLLVISKSENPRCFKGKRYRPFYYASQKSAWMDKSIFTDWYKEVFVPRVEKHKPGDNQK